MVSFLSPNSRRFDISCFASESRMELETQISRAGKLQYLSAEQSTLLQSAATEVGGSLSRLIQGPSTRARMVKTTLGRELTDDDV
jgi:hypothetical protein